MAQGLSPGVPAWVRAMALAVCVSVHWTVAQADESSVSRLAEQSFAAASVGHWSSEQQSADPRYDWVEARVTRIMPERADAVWLYQENAIVGGPLSAEGKRTATAGAWDRPYFQVVIEVRGLAADRVHATTYRVADREATRAVTGGAEFDPAWLGEVACMGEMQQLAAGVWIGNSACPNSYKGATRLDSRSLRAPGLYVNWDRGFDAENALRWGPKDGGYIFKPKED